MKQYLKGFLLGLLGFPITIVILTPFLVFIPDFQPDSLLMLIHLSLGAIPSFYVINKDKLPRVFYAVAFFGGLFALPFVMGLHFQHKSAKVSNAS